MKRWGWGAAALWMAVVGAGSAGSWYAIERAGQEVTSTLPFETVTNGAPSSSPAPTTSASPQPPPGSRPSDSPPAEPTQVRTWTGPAGSVTVSCTGPVGTLVGATPADGWRVERRDSGTEIRVVFERGDSQTRVRARCSATGPSFRVDPGSEPAGENEPGDSWDD